MAHPNKQTATKRMPVFDLLGRILLAGIFVFAAIGKIMDPHGTAEYMTSYGVPAALLPVVIAVELGGGILIILGLWTRWAALALALFSVTAIVIFHHSLHTMGQRIITLAEISFTGGLLVLAANGASCFSLDAWMRRKNT